MLFRSISLHTYADPRRRGIQIEQFMTNNPQYHREIAHCLIGLRDQVDRMVTPAQSGVEPSDTARNYGLLRITHQRWTHIKMTSLSQLLTSASYGDVHVMRLVYAHVIKSSVGFYQDSSEASWEGSSSAILAFHVLLGVATYTGAVRAPLRT